MTTPDSEAGRPSLNDRARRMIRAEILRMTREEGTGWRTRPVLNGAMTETHAEPVAGLKTAAALEYAAARQVRDYMRLAREDGATWTQIGQALGLDGEAGQRAYDRAVGDGQPGWSYDRSFAWRCPDCDGLVLDAGPDGGSPQAAEPGHADNCQRLARESEAWDAQWEAFDREWEAGQ